MVKKLQNNFSISSKTICGEKLSADTEAVNPFKQKFLNYVEKEGLTPEQVFNADESRLFHRLLPKMTLCEKRTESPAGLKGCQEAVTVMPCSKFAVEKKNYRRHGLPKGKPFDNHSIRDKLETIFNRFANNAPKLSACVSTQKNESYNNLVLSKHPKARFYGATKTLHPRVEAAVCQSNEGTPYITKIHANLQLSPGKHTQKFRESKDKLRSKKSTTSQTTTFKVRTVKNKKIMFQKNSSADKREGISNYSSCGLDNFLEPVDESELDLIEEVDLEQSLLVVVDLETNGFGTEKAEICQISAKYKDTTFNAYSTPLSKMSPEAENVTGLKIIRGEMFCGIEKLSTTPIEQFLNNF